MASRSRRSCPSGVWPRGILARCTVAPKHATSVRPIARLGRQQAVREERLEDERQAFQREVRSAPRPPARIDAVSYGSSSCRPTTSKNQSITAEGHRLQNAIEAHAYVRENNKPPAFRQVTKRSNGDKDGSPPEQTAMSRTPPKRRRQRRRRRQRSLRVLSSSISATRWSRAAWPRCACRSGCLRPM